MKGFYLFLAFNLLFGIIHARIADKVSLQETILQEETKVDKLIKDFYLSYAANLEAGSDAANDALMNANMTQGLKAKVRRVASVIDADPVIRAQDFNINSIGTFRVQHLDGNWYMVSYAPDSSKKEQRINIPLRITKIDGRYLIDYITPEWNGSRYGDSILCNRPALQEIDASSPESLLQTFYAAYMMEYSTMPANLSARLNKLREKYCTVNALKQIQAVAQAEEPMYDLLIGGSDFDYLWVPSVTYVRLNENTYRMSYKEGYGSVINVTLRVKKEGRMYRIDAIEVSESS